ncbi:MAG: hypothetical protein V2I25_11725 [Woeseiaceae bacterium]|nr:hypothetical protein [Woeseiaceae bacterium]
MAGNQNRIRGLTAEFLVVFFGITLAFFVENYREDLIERAAFERTLDGLIVELTHYRERGVAHAAQIEDRIREWDEKHAAGIRAVPGYYRLPGSPSPPHSAWEAALASGATRLIPPELRMETGWFYEEYVGIHGNYRRYNEITEREVMPREYSGADAFYGDDGELLPIFRVHRALQLEFAADLERLSLAAGNLAAELEALRSP